MEKYDEFVELLHSAASEEATHALDEMRKTDIMLFITMSTTYALSKDAEPGYMFTTLTFIKNFLKPAIVRPLEKVREEYLNLRESLGDDLKNAVLRGLMYDSDQITNVASESVVYLAKIEFPIGLWPDIMVDLQRIVVGGEYGYPAQVGAMKAMAVTIPTVYEKITLSKRKELTNFCGMSLLVLSRPDYPELQAQALHILRSMIEVRRTTMLTPKFAQAILKGCAQQIDAENAVCYVAVLKFLHFLSLVYWEFPYNEFIHLVLDAEQSGSSKSRAKAAVCKLFTGFYKTDKGVTAMTNNQALVIEFLLDVWVNHGCYEYMADQPDYMAPLAACKCLEKMAKYTQCPTDFAQAMVNFFKDNIGSSNINEVIPAISAMQVLVRLKFEPIWKVIKQAVSVIVNLLATNRASIAAAVFNFLTTLMRCYNNSDQDFCLQMIPLIAYGITRDEEVLCASLSLADQILKNCDPNLPRNFASNNFDTLYGMFAKAETETEQKSIYLTSAIVSIINALPIQREDLALIILEDCLSDSNISSSSFRKVSACLNRFPVIMQGHDDRLFDFIVKGLDMTGLTQCDAIRALSFFVRGTTNPGYFYPKALEIALQGLQSDLPDIINECAGIIFRYKEQLPDPVFLTEVIIEVIMKSILQETQYTKVFLALSNIIPQLRERFANYRDYLFTIVTQFNRYLKTIRKGKHVDENWLVVAILHYWLSVLDVCTENDLPYLKDSTEYFKELLVLINNMFYSENCEEPLVNFMTRLFYVMKNDSNDILWSDSASQLIKRLQNSRHEKIRKLGYNFETVRRYG